MSPVLIRLNVELLEIEQDVKHCGRVVYIKGTALSLTISDHTGQVAWTMFLLKSFLDTQIV
jgi:hypothetical protein